MQSTLLTLLALAAPILSAAVPNLASRDFPAGTKHYPNGLPEDVRASLLAGDKSPLDKRAVVSVFLCTDANYSGYCVDIPSNPSDCVPLGGDLQDDISSVGPDGNAFCTFFVDNGCSGANFGAVAPGYSNLKFQLGGQGPCNGNERNFNDCISSYRCRFN